ncbi:histidinol dehydrogenase [Inquilinus limosus]|uniref:Histidinol dehydrogenase n=1 Tax=Inquilinus limosus TaxID=171674 RepID=A0A211Z6E6_9PROT|nr:histidinol dehydrogenase [Inquilinus limosus]OWJ60830.1 histidinol dehydrogenase [Inquilinus limosus]
MPLRLDARSPGFAGEFEAFVSARRGAHADVAGAVAAIVADTRARGDAALIDYTERFDRVRLTPETLRIGADEIAVAKAQVDAETLAALDLAARRIEAFHAKTELPALNYVDETGIGLGARWTPIDAVGIYVPGGLANYPSSVLMNAIPAKVAGVGRIAMAVPTPDGVLNPLVLAAAERAGVTEIWRVGGAQAVAALAYGTASIRAVDKITGPGNAYVAEAKRQVFGAVGIDMIAGPSEILVVADAGNDPEWIAVDLLSQAEHDPHAQSVLITDDSAFADAVTAAVDRVLARLPKAEIAGTSWRGQGGVIVVGSLDDAPALVDRLAPEHLELAVADPDRIADRVRHAGAIFLGRHAPEAVGDYVAGPNHVLPTARSARFASGLSVFDFVKRTTLVRCDAAGLAKVGPAAVRLARAEGLEAHALSIAQRLKG